MKFVPTHSIKLFRRVFSFGNMFLVVIRVRESEKYWKAQICIQSSDKLRKLSATLAYHKLQRIYLRCMDNTVVKTFWLNSAVKNVRFNCPPHSKVEYDFISLLPVSIWENPTGFQRIRGIKGTVMSDKDVCWLSCFSGMVFFVY